MVLAAAVAVVAVGAASALVYGLVFEHVTRRAGWLPGAAVGVFHGALLAAFIGLVPWIVERAARGSLSVLGWAPLGAPQPGCALAAIVAAGILFGAVVGLAYGAPRHPAEADPSVWWREIHPTSRRFH